MFAARTSLRTVSLLRTVPRSKPGSFTASISGISRIRTAGVGGDTARSISSTSTIHEARSKYNGKRLFWTATAVAAAGVLSTALAQPLLAEASEAPSKSKGGAPFTKEQIGVICIIGMFFPLPLFLYNIRTTSC